MKIYEILITEEFDDWANAQTRKSQVQIDDRLHKIQVEGYFGDHKSVSEDHSVWELRWTNGRRVYYSYLPSSYVLILLGGNKNGQKKDIATAKNILTKRSSCGWCQALGS